MPTRYSLAQATNLILGDDHGLRDPKRWVMVRLRDGRFRGQKIGHRWLMLPRDVAAAKEALYPTAANPEPDPKPDLKPLTVIDGLTARSRRRVMKGA